MPAMSKGQEGCLFLRVEICEGSIHKTCWWWSRCSPSLMSFSQRPGWSTYTWETQEVTLKPHKFLISNLCTCTVYIWTFFSDSFNEFSGPSWAGSRKINVTTRDSTRVPQSVHQTFHHSSWILLCDWINLCCHVFFLNRVEPLAPSASWLSYFYISAVNVSKFSNLVESTRLVPSCDAAVPHLFHWYGIQMTG